MKAISVAASAVALGTLFAGARAYGIADFIELTSGITIFACVTLIVLYVPRCFRQCAAGSSPNTGWVSAG